MKRVLLLLGTLGMVACQKQQSTTTGNPMVALSMTATQNSTAIAMMSFGSFLEKLFFPDAVAAMPPPMVDAVDNAVSLDQGWMVVKEIEFEATEVPGVEEVDGDNVQFRGPYVVNLFSADPELLGSSSVPATSIRRIKMKLSRLETLNEGVIPEMLDKSLYFHGTVGGKEFSFSSDEGTEFQVAGPTALTVHDQMKLLLTVRIMPLIRQINLTYLIFQVDPVIVSNSNRYEAGESICPAIDPSSQSVYDCFRKGLEQQANLGDDQDGSGEIETDESGVHDE